MGIPRTHSGGGGRPESRRDFAQPTILSAFSTIVPRAIRSGTKKTISKPRYRCNGKTALTPQPLLHTQHERPRATTIMVAQMIESRKGNKIQTLAVMSVPMESTASVPG